jgi:hypothetical protein
MSEANLAGVTVEKTLNNAVRIETTPVKAASIDGVLAAVLDLLFCLPGRSFHIGARAEF